MAARQCIVVADKARARLFSVEDSQETPFDAPLRRLTEHSDLVSPEGKLTDEELFRDRRSGRRSRSSVGGGGYGIDDGKDRRREETARRFAKEVVTATADLVRSRKLSELVLVASPKFLGLVRTEMRKALPKSVELTELAEDLTWHAQPQIEKVLTRHGVLETRVRRNVARRSGEARPKKKATRRTMPS